MCVCVGGVMRFKRVSRTGLPEKIDLSENLKEVNVLRHGDNSGETYSRQSNWQVQRPRGRNTPGMREKQRGGPRGWRGGSKGEMRSGRR